MIILHHTGAWEKDMEQVKAYHLRRGWKDIGYNYVIENNGKTRVGRPLTIQGSHTKGYNTRAIGISLIGNFEVKPPTEQQISSVIALCIKLCKEQGIKTDQIVRHKDKANTLCPGKYYPYERIIKGVIAGLKPKDKKAYTVQVGYFHDKKNADRLLKLVKLDHPDAFIQEIERRI